MADARTPQEAIAIALWGYPNPNDEAGIIEGTLKPIDPFPHPELFRLVDLPEGQEP